MVETHLMAMVSFRRNLIDLRPAFHTASDVSCRDSIQPTPSLASRAAFRRNLALSLLLLRLKRSALPLVLNIVLVVIETLDFDWRMLAVCLGYSLLVLGWRRLCMVGIMHGFTRFTCCNRLRLIVLLLSRAIFIN